MISKIEVTMKRRSLISQCVLFAILLIGATVSIPTVAAGSYLVVVPNAHDFGEVEIGSSSTTIIIMLNTNGHPIEFYDISLKAGSSDDFYIVSDLVFPFKVDPTYSFDVEIAFSPTSEGASVAVLQIISDADNPLVEVDLVGVGVTQEPSPSEQIAAILAFFDEAVQDGALIGRGPAGVADWRLNRLRTMLTRAQFLIDRGWFRLACWQLARAYGRTDGQPFPRDYTEGESAVELANMIWDLRVSICD
jgi:hypothetical protein